MNQQSALVFRSRMRTESRPSRLVRNGLILQRLNITKCLVVFLWVPVEVPSAK